MSTYIISSHGTPHWDDFTSIPRETSVLFYTNFGMSMSNQMGTEIQTALALGWPSPYGNKTIWNCYQDSRKVKPYIALTGDMQSFYSGIVRVDGPGNKQVILNLGHNQLVSLSWALDQIRADQPNGHINVHCLFCL